MRTIFILFFTIELAGSVFSQSNLPIGFTVEELAIRSQYYEMLNAKNYISNQPPSSAVRTMAEWEEVDGYLVAWTSFPSMLREIVKYGKEECEMYVLTSNPGNVISDLSNNGIDTSNVNLLNIPFNSVWSRDYGQWCVYTNDVDSLFFIDWIYNRPRPKDDSVPKGLAQHLNIPLYKTISGNNALVNTGGNFMVDGMGTAFASKLVLEENAAGGGFGINHTESQIDDVVESFMGVNRYVKMETLPYDDIHHIDMHMKLLDEQTLLVGEYPTGIADGPQIEANIQYVLSNFQTPFGTPYRIIRIPMPDDGNSYPNSSGRYFTYTNASFINKTIIVPTYNVPEDTQALEIWRRACPGYRVVGINSLPSIGQSGALHCITKEVGAKDPMLITHQRLEDTYVTNMPYIVTAKILHRSGIQSATLYYKTDSLGFYSSVSMSPSGNNIWTAEIPAQISGTDVFYYIEGTSVSGKMQVRPIVAPEGYYRFKVLGAVGLSEVSDKDFSVYPNPGSEISCITYEGNHSEMIQMCLYNEVGQCLLKESKKINPLQKNFFIHADRLAKGFYLITLENGKGLKITKKFIVK